MIDGRNVFDQPVKNNLITYDNIRKTVTGQGDDYTTGCLLDYNYCDKYYKMIAIDLSKKKTDTWCWSKSNTTNWFYRKSRKRSICCW